MRSSNLRLGAGLVLSLLLAGPARAQAPAGAAPPRLVLDAAARAEIVDGLARQITEHYVEPDTAKMIADTVKKKLAAGDYDRLTDPATFAEVVTRDLRKVNGDLHLSLRYDPSGTTPRPVLVRPGGPGAPGGSADGAPVTRRVVVGGPGGAAPPGDPPPGGVRRVVREGGPADSAMRPVAPSMFRNAREQNFGLTKVEILPGNVGYLEVSGFMGTEGYEEAMGQALKFLERTDAVIIDVRRNGGGMGEMSHLLFSHFFPATPVQTIRVKSRENPEPVVQQSVAEVPGPRRTDVPLYVLTSRGTGSAAEEFSFVLKNHRRATLVGDRTAGAGHMVGFYDLPKNFVAGASITRVSDPVSGAEWEGIGVQPDVRVPAENALATAHAMALRALAAKADTDERKKILERTAQWAEVREHAPRLEEARLAAIAGTYEGGRRVEVVDGRLYTRRNPGAMPEELVPMPDGSFAMGAVSRLRFPPGSPSPKLVVERLDGSTAEYPRTAAQAD